MRRIQTSDWLALHNAAATRLCEQSAALTLPPNTLMQRAGVATAQLAQAIAPHARTVWVACGPGNNGGDGIEAAIHLQKRGFQPQVTWLGKPGAVPGETQAAWERANHAGVAFLASPPDHADLCIDALLGISGSRPPGGPMAKWVQRMNQGTAPVLSIDLPTGLQADTGVALPCSVKADHTLSLLTLKPGLFTAMGRDYAGQVWLADLGTHAPDGDACAFLGGRTAQAPLRFPHDSHKGSRGDVAVIGGATGMTGAALLAARAALHAGAGRVMVSLLDVSTLAVDISQPELMMRPFSTLALDSVTAVCGCGGGNAIAATLEQVLRRAPRLVLDADALNCIATDRAMGTLLQARGTSMQTVITPHPLEAARLLGCTTTDVQSHRLNAAQEMAEKFACTVMLKGSGTVIAAQGITPVINPTGNGLLASGGTGDVLAGLVGAGLAGGTPSFESACAAAFLHGALADKWPPGTPLTALGLAQALC